MTTRPDNPTRRDVIEALLAQQSHEMHTSFHARVQHYYEDRGAADLVPLIRSEIPQPDGSIVYDELPVLPHVPVVFPRAGRFGVVFPLEPGDTVLVVCCEAQNGHWWAGADDPYVASSTTHPGDPRRFDLSHAVCVPGLYPRARAFANAPASGGGMVLGKDDGTRVTILPTGELVVTVGGAVVLQIDPDGTVHLGGHPAADFVALAALVDARLEALRVAINTHIHLDPVSGVTGPGGAAPLAATPAMPLAQASVAATKAKGT